MVSIDLSSEEQKILGEILNDALTDLRMEIADTDSLDFRTALKIREELLGKVIKAVL
ncbi:MAG: hypothetical protein WA705_10815 [Candidatus Ozemobacteraceae bacterium]